MRPHSYEVIPLSQVYVNASALLTHFIIHLLCIHSITTELMQHVDIILHFEERAVLLTP